jgi:phenylacetate-CoA ligase
MTTPIYDTQCHHGGIPEIVALSRVAEGFERTDGGSVYYSRQLYDTPENQVRVLELLPELLARRRAAATARARPAPVERLRQLVDHAFETVPFYRSHYGRVGFCAGDVRSLADFCRLPRVTRADLLDVSVADRTSALFKTDRLYTSRTSGSSGAPLDVIYTDEQYVQSMIAYLWQFELALGRPLDPTRWIYNIHHARWWLSSLHGTYRTFSLNDLPPIDALCTHMRALRPQVMAMLPSHARAIAEAGVVLKDFGVEAVTTNSEQSSPAERRRFEQALGVVVRDEYSSVELEQVAFECEGGRHHVLEDGSYAEVVECGDDGIGTIVGTNLNAWAMPMIRYSQGDHARPLSFDCPCRGGMAAFAELLGRTNASFRTRDGRLIPSASLMGVADDFLARRDSGVESYRLVQEDYVALALHYVGRLDVRIDDLRRQLERLFGHDLAIRTIQHERELPALSSYKRQTLVCKLAPYGDRRP